MSLEDFKATVYILKETENLVWQSSTFTPKRVVKPLDQQHIANIFILKGKVKAKSIISGWNIQMC